MPYPLIGYSVAPVGMVSGTKMPWTNRSWEAWKNTAVQMLPETSRSQVNIVVPASTTSMKHGSAYQTGVPWV